MAQKLSRPNILEGDLADTADTAAGATIASRRWRMAAESGAMAAVYASARHTYTRFASSPRRVWSRKVGDVLKRRGILIEVGDAGGFEVQYQVRNGCSTRATRGLVR